MKLLGKINSIICVLAVAGALVSAYAARKLPGELKIRQEDGTVQTWTVRFVAKPMCVAGDSGAKWGVTNCKNRMMTFWSGMTDEQTADIFLHEIMHVVTGCEEREEDLHDTIYTLAPAVRHILTDNPEWAKFVLKAPVSTPLLQYGTGPMDESCMPAMRTSANTTMGK